MRVIITGDVARPLSVQKANINWLYYMLRQNYSRHSIEIFDEWEPLTLDGWIETFSNLDVPHPLFEAYHDLCQTLIIGFEMPPNLIYQLESNNILYTNYIIYPIRYCNDLIVGYKSNYEFFDGVDESLFYKYADAYRARGLYCPMDVPENTWLIIRQLDNDASLINDGKMQVLDDKDIEGKNCIDRLHPAVGNPDSRNIYDLLACPNVDGVIGVSSSVLFEAKYFGKKVIMQGRNWASGYTPITAKTFLEMDVPDNYLRNSCNSYWGKK